MLGFLKLARCSLAFWWLKCRLCSCLVCFGCIFVFGPLLVPCGCLEQCVQQDDHDPFVTAGESEACWLLGSHQPGNAVPDLGPVQPPNPPWQHQRNGRVVEGGRGVHRNRCTSADSHPHVLTRLFYIILIFLNVWQHRRLKTSFTSWLFLVYCGGKTSAQL